ncbi:antibiotic biosynthesis monooxygenase [Microbacterium sp. CFH 90308]|uniref:Antibiotic biosynthesis monooxygenase n=1 Tax=Microbacterium salsuginis TaxID=2722803 RepID=A0ABX1KI25_9MICO|nr:antibiotic biosynthesis monooxygenase [Microbacterium sp. CFH 90308]NLP85011.1 antibiotic biosynthesis monooxygenase [Microbacterium sp. CFH 90308]
MDVMAEPVAHPITVAIERRIDPSRTAEATSWMQAGTDLAAGFPGFLGSGWVRAGESSDLWYMLYRFRDIPTLEDWEQSGQRAWWLESGRAFASEVRVERRTGIEGWFDAPFATDVEPRDADGRPRGAGASTPTGPVQQPIPPAPPRWKQAVTIWLGFFPTNLLASWLLGFVPGFSEWPLIARVVVTTVLLTPVMTYAVLPWVTRMLRPWLHRSV